MITIKIGNDQRSNGDISERWINRSINRRRADGHIVCTQVTIRDGDIDMILQTSTCQSGGGGGRKPRPIEREIFDLWGELGLNDEGYAGGQLVAFIKQVERLLSRKGQVLSI